MLSALLCLSSIASSLENPKLLQGGQTRTGTRLSYPSSRWPFQGHKSASLSRIYAALSPLPNTEAAQHQVRTQGRAMPLLGQTGQTTFTSKSLACQLFQRHMHMSIALHKTITF